MTKFERFARAVVIGVCYPFVWLSQRVKKYYFFDGADRRPPKVMTNTVVVMNHGRNHDPRTLFCAFKKSRLYFLASEFVFSHGKDVSWLVGLLGAIRVDRKNLDVSFFRKSVAALKGGGTLCVFPEGRVHPKTKELLPFRASFAAVARRAGSRIVPVYSDGGGRFKRTRVMIDKPYDIADMMDANKSDRENYENIALYMQSRVGELGKELERRKAKKHKNGK